MPNIGPAMLVLVAETGALHLLAAAAALPSDVEVVAIQAAAPGDDQFLSAPCSLLLCWMVSV